MSREITYEIVSDSMEKAIKSRVARVYQEYSIGERFASEEVIEIIEWELKNIAKQSKATISRSLNR